MNNRTKSFPPFLVQLKGGNYGNYQNCKQIGDFTMKRILLTLGCSLALTAAAGSAWAQATCNNPSPFPANSKPVCENTYSGVFSSNEVKICTVMSSQTVQQCTPDVSAVVSSITTYTKKGGHCDTQTGEPTIVGCVNSQGSG